MDMWKKIKKNIVYLLLIAGVASVPLMTDYVLEGSSLASTLSHIEVMRQGIGRVFPIRIGAWGSMDYGYGAASFQADVFYLLPATLRLLGMGLGNAYKLTLLLFHLGTAVISYACFEKCFGRQDAGLLAGMLYTWCPYRCSEMYLAGELGDMAAWMFLPVLMLGLKRLYTDDVGGHDYGRLWVLLTWGYSLVLLSSTVVFFAAAAMTIITLLFMGKKTLRRRTLLVLGRTAAASALVNAWFLFPMLLRMREVSAVGVLIPRDVRGMGMYLIQYLTAFSWGGDGVDLAENGLGNAQAMGPGIIVALILLVWLWALFTGQRRRNESGDFAVRMLWVSGAMMLLGSNLFPWDLFQDRNMLFSILLAFMGTPAKLGIAACLGLIYTACQAYAWMTEDRGEKERRIWLLLVTAVSFSTTQFLLNNILRTRSFVRGEEIEALGTVPLPLVTQESLFWRLSEAVSAAALCGCIVMWIVRRRKRDRKCDKGN